MSEWHLDLRPVRPGARGHSNGFAEPTPTSADDARLDDARLDDARLDEVIARLDRLTERVEYLVAHVERIEELTRARLRISRPRSAETDEPAAPRGRAPRASRAAQGSKPSPGSAR